jgi:hypothetical protein
MANGLIYEQLEKGELRTPQGKKVGSFTTNTLPRQVGKPKKRKGQKTSIPQSTYAKGMKRVKDQAKAAMKSGNWNTLQAMDAGFKGHTKMERKIYKKKADADYKKHEGLKKFIKADKRFRVK